MRSMLLSRDIVLNVTEVNFLKRSPSTHSYTSSSFCFALVVKETGSKQTNSSLRVFVLACVHSFLCTACMINVKFPECVLIVP